MKTLLFLTLFISGNTIAQTNVIAAKSHASDRVIHQNDADNFGIPIPRRKIIRVEYLSSDCLIEVSEMIPSMRVEQEYDQDTICDHPFLQSGQIDVKRIKEMYGKDIEFIGFKELEKKQKKESKWLKKEEKREKQSSTLIIFVIGASLFLIYIFVPKRRTSHSSNQH